MDRQQLATEAAFLYYDFQLTQAQVARQLGVSRSTVSRALADAERTGVVRHIVNAPLPSMMELEAALLERTSLHACRIVPDGSDLGVLARAAASFIDGRLTSQSTVALGWGRSVRAIAENLPPRPLPELRCVDAVGHANVAETANVLGTTRAFAANYGSRHIHHIITPAITSGARTPSASDEYRPVVDRARTADLVIVSVGSVDGDAAILRMTDLLSIDNVNELAARGAVGDVLGHFIDADGQRVDGGPQVFGLTLDDLRANPDVVVVSSGAPKYDAVAATVRSRLANSLVCDQPTAEFVLANAGA